MVSLVDMTDISNVYSTVIRPEEYWKDFNPNLFVTKFPTMVSTKKNKINYIFNNISKFINDPSGSQQFLTLMDNDNMRAKPYKYILYGIRDIYTDYMKKGLITKIIIAKDKTSDNYSFYYYSKKVV